MCVADAPVRWRGSASQRERDLGGGSRTGWDWGESQIASSVTQAGADRVRLYSPLSVTLFPFGWLPLN